MYNLGSLSYYPLPVRELGVLMSQMLEGYMLVTSQPFVMSIVCIL
jgi:hypothetical protein